MQQMVISREVLKTAKTETARIREIGNSFTVNDGGKVFFILCLRGFYLRHIVFENATIRYVSGDIPSPDEEVTLLMNPRAYGITKIAFAPEGTQLTS